VADFQLTYQDYLNHYNSQQHGSEGGDTGPLTEEQFNAIPASGRWSTVNGRVAIIPGDPRYNALNETARAETGRNIIVEQGAPNYRADWINDWDRIVRGDGWHALSEDNFSPDWSREQETHSRRIQQGAIRSAIGVLAGGALAGAGVGAGVDPMAAAPGQGFGTLGSSGAADIVGALGTVPNTPTGNELDVLTEGEHLTYNTPDYVPPPGSGDYTDFDAFDATPEGPGPDWPNLPNETGGLPPESLGPDAPGGMSVRTDGLGSWNSLPWADRISGVLSNPGSLFSSTGMLAQLGGGALDALGDLANVPGGIPGGQPQGGPGGGGGGGSGGSSYSGPGGAGGKKAFQETEMNPYAKQKLTPVDALLAYLKGAGSK
jgi:hypothetical protein